MLMNHYGRFNDFDLTTFLRDAVHTVDSVLSPTPKPPQTIPLTSPVTSASAPLFTVGGFRVTPTAAVVGVAAIGAAIYFASKRKRR